VRLDSVAAGAALAALAAALLTAGAPSAARAGEGELEELFSRHVRVLKPQGRFAPRLIRAAPGGGEGWRRVEDPGRGYRLALPDTAQVDSAPEGRRTLQAVLSDAATRPRPVFRVDVFPTGEGEATDVDLEYLAGLVEQYPEKTFGGRFSVTDSGMIVIGKPKQNLAMVGGVGSQGAARLYRMQWVLLGPQQQVFLTFDCAEEAWERYADTVARILLSFESTRRKKG